MTTKGHQFRAYRKQDPGAQAAQAAMAFQTTPAAPGPGEDTCRAAEVLKLRAEAATGKTVITPVDMPTGNLDLGLVDTTPGEGGAMSPPAGSDLTAAQYQDLMRKRYRADPWHRQHMALWAKRGAPCTGPYAEQARAILGAIRERKT
jgi:hypothetical protein